MITGLRIMPANRAWWDLYKAILHFGKSNHHSEAGLAPFTDAGCSFS